MDIIINEWKRQAIEILRHSKSQSLKDTAIRFLEQHGGGHGSN